MLIKNFHNITETKVINKMAMDEEFFRQFEAQFRVFSQKRTRQSREDSTSGVTLIEFLLRMDRELLELVQSLNSTNPFSDFDRFSRRHTEIVAYLLQLGRYGLVDSSDLNIADIDRYRTLQDKYVRAAPLITEVERVNSKLEALESRRKLVYPFLVDYKAALLADPYLRPSAVREKLEDRVLVAEAHSEFIKKFASGRDVGDAEPNQVKAILPATSDRVTGLDLMVRRYMVGTFYLQALDEFIGVTRSGLAAMQSQLRSFDLTPQEITDLDTFKKGVHPIYNAGRYFNNYYRTLVANAIKFFKDLGYAPKSG